ncbi:hypothetical protein BegalDRAFT_0940 [Beggiatoa alba B18LD]|uniref:HicB-like antitoxin of toxin-antitoxin system domain-containing protein n=1 Tax=Beggiatoa alba B18LD TaxID=395493 RepID=I3CE04_9GAMM|nr:type II toxin-antitoxin system HicB family antitoxin [Beggiatoa alba]EIJ41847.1 hypothetical protein BegalDRAFT_0940 [Beggiatoa alba B18LD]
MFYTVILEPDEDGVWVAECLELLGCFSQGKTQEEALNNIKDAIKLYLEVKQELNMHSQRKVCQVEVA